MRSTIVETTPGTGLPLHRHGDARAILVLAGEVRETELYGRSVYRPGDVIVRPPYHLHANDRCAAPAVFMRLFVSASAWRAVVARRGWRSARGRIDLSRADEASLLRARFAGDALLSAMFWQSRPDCAPADPGGVLARIASALRGPGGREVRVGALARAAGLEPYELTRRFGRCYGLTPTAYRREARLQRAMALLSGSDDALAQVAVEAGYADQSHLCRELRRATGRSPGEIRGGVLGD